MRLAAPLSPEYSLLNHLVEEDCLAARDSLSQVFAALSDPNRRAMVARLCESDAALVELAEPLDMSMQAVAKHLRVLEHAALSHALGTRSVARHTSKRRSSI